ncbi:terminase small subunit [Streptococcus suis]|uniref:terminase small subunit n=1 Tax=Streptococcus suis TaxID=1307 RepID=UPI000CF4BA92|nr:terminase small subunit [Streptococcus suis]
MKDREKQAINELKQLANNLMSDWPPSRNRQKSFVLAYMANGFQNATQAAKEAGFSEKTARITAHKMLAGTNKFLHIPPVIKKLENAYHDRLEELSIMTATELMQYWSKGARGELQDYALVGLGQGEQEIREVPMDQKTRLAFSQTLARSLGVDKQKIEVDATVTTNKLDGILAQLEVDSP